MSSPHNFTEILASFRDGDPDAADQLLPAIYDQLHALAEAYMRQERPGHTLQATALVNEAYMRLVGQTCSNWEDQSHFLAVAAQAMRRILVDHAKARRRQKRGGDRERSPLDEVILTIDDRGLDVVAVDEALTQLAEIKPEYARLVEMRFFAGMTIDETAKALGTSTATVGRTWRVARAWLYDHLAKGDTKHGGGPSDVE